MSQFLTPKEVARLYEVDVTTVYRWIQSGQLPARRLAGRAYRIIRADAEALLAPVEPGASVPLRHQRGPEAQAGQVVADA